MIKKLTSSLLNKCINEFKREENKQRLNDYIIKPLIHNISSRLYPYIILLFIMYVLILGLIIAILVMLLNKTNS